MSENDKYLKTADWEGYKPKVYLDTKKKKTIGHGFNLDDSVIKSYLIKKGYDYNALATGKQSLSEKHSNDILKDLYNQSYKSTEKIIKNFKELPEDVKHVLTDLNYNLGTTRMQKFAKMISAIEKQDFKTAAEELKNSNYYNQTGRRAKSHYETLSSVKPVSIEKPAISAPFEPSWVDIGKAYLANPMLPQFAGALLYDKLFSSVPSETPEKQASGGLIKRADGSYSKRGLWDNIRANKGSGKEPTPEMLKQERKIRRAEKKEDGGLIESYENGGWLDSYEDGGEIDGGKARKTVKDAPPYVISEDEKGNTVWRNPDIGSGSLGRLKNVRNKNEYRLPFVGITDYNKSYIGASINPFANTYTPERFDSLFSADYHLGTKLNPYARIGGGWNFSDIAKTKTPYVVGAEIGVEPMLKVGKDRNIIISPRANVGYSSKHGLYNTQNLEVELDAGKRDGSGYGFNNPFISIGRTEGLGETTYPIGIGARTRYKDSDGRQISTFGAYYDPLAKVYGGTFRHTFDTGKEKREKYKGRPTRTFEDGSWVTDSSIPTPTSPNFYPDYNDPTLTNYQMGTPKSNLPIRGLRDATPNIPAYGYGGLIPMYAAGATVWTKQDTPTWAAGTPTPTATQNFKNTNSINTDNYRIGDVIPTGMDYKKPSSQPVMQGYNPYNGPMRLYASDTTIMAKYGGKITEDYKKRKGIPYSINPGISFADGGLIKNKFKNGGWLDNL